jgi:transcriptional regulator with XRE-family HTH domain
METVVRMARLFKRLREAVADADMDAPELAHELGVSACTISSRLNGHTQWQLDEMYNALRLLGRPASDLPRLFPPGGQNEEGCSRGRAAVTGRRVARSLPKCAGRRN